MRFSLHGLIVRFSTLLVVPGASLAFLSTCASADVPALKVGLSRALGGDASLNVTSASAILIQQGDDGKLILRTAPGSTYTVTSTRTGIELTRVDGQDQQTIGRFPYPLVFAPAPPDATDGPASDPASPAGIKMSRIDPDPKKSMPHRYRGTLTVRKVPDGMLSVVDTVDLEDYLYGVVAPEMGGNAPAEALKAQAVASRTYALKNRGRFASDGFDVDDSTRSQQYDGMDGETPATVAAVDATRGQVLTYDGKLIDAYFSTDNGGMTAVDTSGDHPYFQAVADSPGDGQPDYDASSKYRDWDCVFSQDDLVKLLSKDPRTSVSSFACLTIDDVDASGRVKTATVSDTDGTMKTVTGPELREILGYDTLRSTRVTLTVKANGDYLFHGHGWGHGFGMSQVGAIGMASTPYNKTYLEILTHYYVGVKVVDESSATDLARIDGGSSGG